MTDGEAFTAEFLRSEFHYDPETGVFTNRVLRRSALPGDRAGTMKPNGYRRIGILKRYYYEHRLAWLYMTGSWPEGEIDHANGDPSDNRWCNLRPATRSQQSANRPLQKNNTTGLKGVQWHKVRKRWMAVITVDRKTICLGFYHTPEAAYEAYCKASDEYFGPFSRVA